MQQRCIVPITEPRKRAQRVHMTCPASPSRSRGWHSLGLALRCRSRSQPTLPWFPSGLGWKLWPLPQKGCTVTLGRPQEEEIGRCGAAPQPRWSLRDGVGGGHKWGGHSGAWLSEHVSAHLICRPWQPLFLALPCPLPTPGPLGNGGRVKEPWACSLRNWRHLFRGAVRKAAWCGEDRRE